METIRQCSENDLEILRELSAETFRETFAPMNTPEDMKAYLESSFIAEKFRRELRDVSTTFFLLYSGGKAAGYLKLNDAPSQTDINDPASLEVERIYVLAEFQGCGFGALLMDKAVSVARERGRDYLWLGVWEKNEKAQGFYRKRGFYRIGEHSFVIGSDRQTDYLMRLDISSGS